jgi:hypothetical protein
VGPVVNQAFLDLRTVFHWEGAAAVVVVAVVAVAVAAEDAGDLGSLTA